MGDGGWEYGCGCVIGRLGDFDRGRGDGSVGGWVMTRDARARGVVRALDRGRPYRW